MKILVQLNPLQIEKVKSGFNHDKKRVYHIFENATEAERFVREHFQDLIIKAKKGVQIAENDYFDAIQALNKVSACSCQFPLIRDVPGFEYCADCGKDL